MIKINAEKRESLGKKVKALREAGIIPAVLYGPKTENQNIQLNFKEFEKILKEAGESTLIALMIEEKEYPVLIHETKKDPLTGSLIHVDFYQPILTEETEVEVAIVFEGEPMAVKELGGTLVKEIQEIAVKALPQDLPHEIRVDVSILETFDDEIKVKDLRVSEKVTIQRDPEDVVALVTPATKVEEELEKPIAPADAEGSGEAKEGETDEETESDGSEEEGEVEEEPKKEDEK